MEEDFVPFEIAKKLKEKGYPQVEKSTIAMYDEDGCLSHLCPTFNIDRCYYIFDDFDESDCVAPTISQVLKWLREEKKIHIRLSVYFIGWCYDITMTEGKYNRLHGTECEYYSYKEAALAGIEYVLDNLI